MLMEMSKSRKLESLYMPSQWCFRRCSPELVVQKHIEIVNKESALVKQEIPCKLNIKYGNNPRQLMHMFTPFEDKVEDGISTLVYIHGGYWQSLDKEISCYCVKPLVKSGIRVIVPDYDLVPDVPLNTIIKEIEELIIFLVKLKTDNRWGSIWLTGHSAGAHLAATILQTNLCEQIAGFILISGIYDLAPLLETSVNDALGLTLSDAIKASPFHELTTKQLGYSGFVLLVVGEFDSPAFHEQQLKFAELLKLKSKSTQVECSTIENEDHFSVVEFLSCEDYYLTGRIIDIILQRK